MSRHTTVDWFKGAVKIREFFLGASYLREYPVLKDDVYDQVLKAVLGEVMTGESEQNLFVHQMQQAALSVS